MNQQKKVKTQVLLAVDPSLTSTGWACFSLHDGQPFASGLVTPPGPKVSLPHRMSVLQSAVTSIITGLGCQSGDVLICEGPAPLVKNPQSAIKVEGVRGVFEAVARSVGMDVPGRLNPRTVQSELLGMRGKQLGRQEVKAWARETANRLFNQKFADIVPPSCRTKDGTVSQDIIDALLIGAVAVSRVQVALKAGVSLDSAFAPSGRSTRGYRGSASGRETGRKTGWSELVFQRRFAK